MPNPKSIETEIRYASMRQIHEAIQHLHRGDFECAITLAAAGEGMLPETDKPHFRQKVVALEQKLPKTEGGENSANAFINWLKHGTLKQNGPRIENGERSYCQGMDQESCSSGDPAASHHCAEPEGFLVEGIVSFARPGLCELVSASL